MSSSILNIGLTTSAVTVYSFAKADMVPQGALLAKGDGYEQKYVVVGMEAGTVPTTVVIGVYPQIKANQTILKIALKGSVDYDVPGVADNREEHWYAETKVTLPGMPQEWNHAGGVGGIRDILMTLFGCWYGSVSGGVMSDTVITNMILGIPSKGA